MIKNNTRIDNNHLIITMKNKLKTKTNDDYDKYAQNTNYNNYKL